MEIIGKLPKIDNSVDVQITMRDLYETKFGIFSHIGASKNRPLASVAFHPAEDFTSGSRLQDTTLMYHRSRIKEYLGIDFLDFIQMTPEVIQDLVEVCNQISQKPTSADVELSKLAEGLKK